MDLADLETLIINSFIYNNDNSISDIFFYVSRFNKNITKKQVKSYISILKRRKIIIELNNNYSLTNCGKIIKDDNIYYASNIIFEALKKIKLQRKYTLKEIRMEQSKLRNYLLQNKVHQCAICDKKKPSYLLETAHLKPRAILNGYELYDNNIVELMCSECHLLYDHGDIGVDNGKLKISSKIFNANYNIDIQNNKSIKSYSTQNDKYFSYHYNHIFKN